MNESALNYRLYQFMLEGKISSQQRERLVELGFLQKIASWLGGGYDVTKNLGKAIANNAHRREFESSKKDITKGIESLKSVAKKAGISDDDVASFLRNVLDGAGAPDLSQAVDTSSERRVSDVGSSAVSKAAGSILKPDSEDTKQTLVQAVATLKNKEPEKLMDDAKDVVSASSMLGKVIAKISGVPADDASLVISTLVDLGKLKKEGRRAQSKHLISASQKIGNALFIQERWVHLSGLSLLTEAQNVSNQKIVDAALSLGITSEEEFKKALQQINKSKNSPLGEKLGLKNKYKDLTGNKKLLDSFKSAIEKGSTGTEKPTGEKIEPQVSSAYNKEIDHVMDMLSDIKNPNAFNTFYKEWQDFMQMIPIDNQKYDFYSLMKTDSKEIGSRMAKWLLGDGGSQSRRAKVFGDSISNFLKEWDMMAGGTGAFDAYSKEMEGEEKEAVKDVSKTNDTKSLPQGKDQTVSDSASITVPQDDKVAIKQAKQNFSSSLSAVSDRLKNKVTVANISKVLIALDETGEIEVVN